MKKGLFIVFDGIDGSGKTENVKMAFQYILDKDKSYDAILVTREPTNRKYGQKIRTLLKSDRDPMAEPRTYLKLFINDRKDHVDNVIKPILRQNAVVICDRYKYTTYAYQIVQGNKLEVIDKLHEGMLKPDIAFIFDLPAEEAWRRMGKAINSKNSSNYRDMHTVITKSSCENGRVSKEKFEDLKFLSETRQIFLKMKEFFPKENIIIINANQSKDKVSGEIKKQLDKLLPY